MGQSTSIYTLAVDYGDGRTPTYERQIAWRTTEERARHYFSQQVGQFSGLRCALVGNAGRILAVR